MWDAAGGGMLCTCGRDVERVCVEVVGSVTVAKRGTKATPDASITVGAAPAAVDPPLLLVLVVVVLVGLPPCGAAVAVVSGAVLPLAVEDAPVAPGAGPPVVLICT